MHSHRLSRYALNKLSSDFTIVPYIGVRTICASSKPSRPRRNVRWVVPDDGKTLQYFTRNSRRRHRQPLAALSAEAALIPEGIVNSALGTGLSVFIETKGCQMNVNDTEIVRALLSEAGYSLVSDRSKANIILINTCAIRDKAEESVWQWLRMQRADERKAGRKTVIGVLGCMAERLKTDILERDKLVDVVVGPDAYRSLPTVLAAVAHGEPGAAGYNVQLSIEETYADVTPMRESNDKSSAFVSIMRGCSNYCSFCVVPYTRGQERSRPLESIVSEVRKLSDEGVKEVTLLGQNVNSWHISAKDNDENARPVLLAEGFRSASRIALATKLFPDLLHEIASINREMRIRFTSPHPKDFPNDVLQVMRDTPNICKSIHMPAQSGSNSVLERMKRRYTREAYLDLVHRIRETIPGVTLSTDMISGFCGETDGDHADTIDLLRRVEYDQGFFFHYSRRERTEAARLLEDNVPKEIKLQRLREVIDTFHEVALEKNNRNEIGAAHLVLVEEGIRKLPSDWNTNVRARTGRTDGNKRVVFEDMPMRHSLFASDSAPRVFAKPGDYVAVQVNRVSSLTLFCTPLARTSLQEYAAANMPLSSSVLNGSNFETSVIANV